MTDKNASQWMRLRDNHPTMIKLSKLWDLAEELGITISFMGQATIVDDEDQEQSFRMEDAESGDPVGEFPVAFEYKLIYENPVYLKEKEDEYQAYLTELKTLKDKNEKEAK